MNSSIRLIVTNVEIRANINVRAICTKENKKKITKSFVFYGFGGKFALTWNFFNHGWRGLTRIFQEQLFYDPSSGPFSERNLNNYPNAPLALFRNNNLYHVKGDCRRPKRLDSREYSLRAT